ICCRGTRMFGLHLCVPGVIWSSLGVGIGDIWGLVAAHYHPNGEMKRHVRAFIYVAAVLGKESKVADALFKLAEVKEVHVIPGRHDIMAVVEVPRKLLEPDAQSLYWLIVDRIKTIGDVQDTETLIPIVLD